MDTIKAIWYIKVREWGPSEQDGIIRLANGKDGTHTYFGELEEFKEIVYNMDLMIIDRETEMSNAEILRDRGSPCGLAQLTKSRPMIPDVLREVESFVCSDAEIVQRWREYWEQHHEDHGSDSKFRDEQILNLSIPTRGPVPDDDCLVIGPRTSVGEVREVLAQILEVQPYQVTLHRVDGRPVPSSDCASDHIRLLGILEKKIADDIECLQNEDLKHFLKWMCVRFPDSRAPHLNDIVRWVKELDRRQSPASRSIKKPAKQRVISELGKLDIANLTLKDVYDQVENKLRLI